MQNNTLTHALETTLTVASAIAESERKTSQWAVMNVRGMGEIQTQFGIGLLDFNAYVHGSSFGAVNVRLLNAARIMSVDVRYWMTETESESGFYVVHGSGGLQGGKCERFTFPAAAVRSLVGESYSEDETAALRDWLRHPSGSVVPAGLIRKLRFVEERELVKLASEGIDLRKFKVTARESGKESFYAGAVVGAMAEKRQLLVFNDGQGLDGVCLTTGRIGATEKADRAVEIGALTDAEKAQVRAAIFQGIVAKRLKDDKRNAVRKTRKLDRIADKAKAIDKASAKVDALKA